MIKKSSTGGAFGTPQTPLRFLRGLRPLKLTLIYEKIKEPWRSHESFGGSFASRSLTGVEKQRIWYSVKTPILGATTAATTATAAKEFPNLIQPHSHHAQGWNIAFGFPLTAMLHI